MLVWKNTFLCVCFMSDNFHLFIFLCVLKIGNWAHFEKKGIEQLGLGTLNMVTSYCQTYRYRITHWQVLDPLTSQESFLEWWSSCLHVIVLCENVMHGSILACTVFSYLRKGSFSSLIEYLLCRTEFCFVFHQECWDENRSAKHNF